MRLGSLRPKSIDVRFVAATHRDLEEMVARGAFRQDLYYRLNGVSLTIPPLRDRVEEIPRIANELVARFCRESKRPILPISDAAMAVLKSYPWPGNVRELRNVVERAVVFCRTVAITPEHLGLGDRTSRPPAASQPPMQAAAPVAPVDPLGATAFGVAPPPPAAPAPPAHPSTIGAGTVAFGSASLPDEVDALERERILAALARCGGNQTQAAEMLGISRRTLLRRLDAYALPRPRKG